MRAMPPVCTGGIVGLPRRPGGFRCRRPRRALPQLRVTLAQLEAAINEGFAARDMAAMVPYMEDKTR